MAWKLDELLYGSQNFETRKTNNRSHRTIDPVVITEIEEKGITSEQLKELHVPVFKYKTQITIHGLFPEIGAGRIGGYKFLIRNQNGSLGVKYNAVDHAKKERIYSYLHHHGYGIDKNSTDWIAYKTGKYQTEKSALAADVEVFKAAKERINNKLFIGTVTVGVYVNPYAGYYAALIITIGAVDQDKVDVVIENITQKPLAILDAEIQVKKDEEKKQNIAWEAKWKQEREEAAVKEKQRAEETDRIATAAGLIKVMNLPTARPGYFIRIKIEGDKAEFWVRHIYKDRSVMRVGRKQCQTMQEAIETIRTDSIKEAGTAHKPFKPSDGANIYQLPA